MNRLFSRWGEDGGPWGGARPGATRPSTCGRTPSRCSSRWSRPSRDRSASAGR